MILVLVNFLFHGDQMEAKMWSDDGLLSDAWSIQISNILIGPLLRIFDVSYFIKLLKQFKAKMDGDKNNLTQQ